MPEYPRYSERRRDALVSAASAEPNANPEVEYPEWYLAHHHFIPGGYLSRRGAAFFDTVVRPMYGAWNRPALYRKLARLIAVSHPGGAVLELGCGTGDLLVELARPARNLHVTGIDLSPVLLSRAERRLWTAGLTARLVHGDASALPFEDRQFDAVVAQHLLGHVPAAAAAAMLGEASRVLRPGGRIYVVEHRWHTLPLEVVRVMRTISVPRSLANVVVAEALAEGDAVCDTPREPGGAP